MDTKDKLTIGIAIAAFCVSCIAVSVSIKSCSIAEDQAERYYEEIKYIGERDINKNLIIKQISGSKYYLKEIELVPTFLGKSGSLYEEGTPFGSAYNDVPGQVNILNGSTVLALRAYHAAYGDANLQESAQGARQVR